MRHPSRGSKRRWCIEGQEARWEEDARRNRGERVSTESWELHSAIWQLARSRGCVLVTKDEDFHRLSILQGAPPKVVWLRLGNCRTSDIAQLLRVHVGDIRAFVNQTEATFLELG